MADRVNVAHVLTQARHLNDADIGTRENILTAGDTGGSREAGGWLSGSAGPRPAEILVKGGTPRTALWQVSGDIGLPSLPAQTHPFDKKP